MTSIEWTDETWNFLVGCSRVSAGCERCYAERTVHRGLAPQHRGLTVMGKKGPRWTGEVRLVEHRLSEALRWRKPRRVFVNSLSDLFHESVSNEIIAAAFGVMAAAPQHTFQILTKRPERARAWFAWVAEREEQGRKMFPDDDASWRIGQMLAVTLRRLVGLDGRRPGTRASGWEDFDPRRAPWPLPNVDIGVSIENQATADERIPELLRIPAARLWVSQEPQLGEVTYREEWLRGGFSHCPIDGIRASGLDSDLEDGCEGCPGYGEECAAIRGPAISWVVVGGESGPGARPFDLAWARKTVAQCKEAGVACFVKQLGAKPRYRVDSEMGEELPSILLDLRSRKGGDPAEWPVDLRVRELPEAHHAG